MSLLNKLFPKKHSISRREMPSWNEIVEYMQGKELSFFSDTVVRVIESKDRTKRIIILQSDNGYYKMAYEEICVWDENEWKNYCKDPNIYPAYWNPAVSSINNKSFYGSESDVFSAIIQSHEYQTYFV